MRRLPPVIRWGWSMFIMLSSVGDRSRKLPPSRTVMFFSSETRMKGTGLVVWAVCGPPVAGSMSSSALPWSGRRGAEGLQSSL
jgi:hypothetical protein